MKPLFGLSLSFLCLVIIFEPGNGILPPLDPPGISAALGRAAGGHPRRDPGATPDLARVNQLQGIYVFTDSRPDGPYTYLGTVKQSGTFRSNQYSTVRDLLIKRLKNDYPGADGAIFHFTSGEPDRADAIKLQP